MNIKLVKKYNKYNLGGMTNNPMYGLGKLLLPGLTGGLLSTINTIGNKLSGINIGNTAIGMGANLAGNLIAGEKLSDVGNFLLTAGGVVGAVNPIIGGAVGLAGGLFNAAFGSKLNKDFIAQTEANINQLRNIVSNATDTTSMLADYSNFNLLNNVRKSQVGSDGWFSNKAKRKTRALNRGIDDTNIRALLSLDNTAENVDTELDFNIMLNYKAAYGGPIHIKKENRGKFTDYCGGKVTNECILRGLNSHNPLTRKRANFARNARGWSHDDGGELNFNWNDLNKNLYGLLTYNGTPLLSIKDRNLYNIENNNISRNTPFGYLVGDENLKLADLTWSGLEMVPFVGNIMGIGDVVNDVYNIYNSDNISSGDISNLMLDIGGLIPGVSTITKASKLAKATKALRLANKLDNVSDKLKYTSALGIKEIKNRVRDAKDFSKKSENMAIAAALSRDKLDLFKAAMKAREASKFNQGILEGVDKALDPVYTKYNIYQNVTNKADAMNDFFNFTGNVENNIKAEGGLLDTNFSNGVTIIGNGGSHELNPREGVQVGIDEYGIPNLVEEGEVIWNNYVFSNRLKPTKELLEIANLPTKYVGKTYADIAKEEQKESKERPNDPLSKRGLYASMNKLQTIQEMSRQLKLIGQEGNKNMYAKGGYKSTVNTPFDSWLLNMYNTDILELPTLSKFKLVIPDNKPRLNKLQSPIDDRSNFDKWYKNVIKEPSFTLNTKSNNSTKRAIKNKLSSTSKLRYAPVLGAAIGLTQGLLSKPDYSSADAVMEAANLIGNYLPVSDNPIGNYLSYKPLDRNYYLNRLDAAANASRRAVMNTSSPSRQAALLAADYNYINNLGNFARQAEEYNLALRERIEGFNRGTNQTNAEIGLRAAMANQHASALARNARMSGIALAMAMRNNIDATRNAGINANLTGLFDSLGNIGKEAFAMDMIRNNPALYYDWLGNYKKGGRNG